MSFLRHTYNGVNLLPMTANQGIIAALKTRKQAGIIEMSKKYPHILVSDRRGEMAYMLRPESPHDMIAQGGFVSHHKELWLSQKIGSADSWGGICFTLLPKVAMIFIEGRIDKANLYIYAVQFNKEGEDLVLPGGKWRQVISPRAFPLPTFWRARKILEIIGDKVILGPVVGQGDLDPNMSRMQDESYAAFMSKTLQIPEKIGIGEDHPEEYVIEDTAYTAEFQETAAKHYHKLSGNLSDHQWCLRPPKT